MTRKFCLSCLSVAFIVSVAPPVSADTFMVYSQGGIPNGSNLYTWCDTPPCEVLAPLSCATDPFDGVVASPEGGNSLLLRTNVWAGWGVFPQQTQNLSAYQNGALRFWVKAPPVNIGAYNIKVEFQCNPDPVMFPAGVTYTTSIAAHGWDGTSNWQEIVIPLVNSSFNAPARPLDAACFSTVKAPFLSTIENLPFFNQYWVDYVRWETPNSHSGASSVQVQGRELLVNGEPFVVNGVAYSPISIGENWAGAWRDRPDRYTVDFPLIAASGANTVRLYAPLLSTAMLDAAWAAGLHVIPTFGVDTVQLTCPAGRDFMRDRFREMVLQWKDHPAILFWLVGNEVNLNLGGVDLCTVWYPQLDSMALAAHTAEGASFHPVATANADLADICLAGCSDDTALPNVDLWATQLYRGCSFGTAFAEYAGKLDCARPLVVTEFGMDAWDSLLSVENETMQASCLDTLLAEADEALTVRTPGGVSSGVVVFEWADEWWKAECDPGTAWTTHDTCTSFSNLGYPDPGINEEWWGLVSLDAADPNARVTRSAHDRMGEAYLVGAACNVDVVSYDSATGNTSISFGPGAGSTDHTLHYGPLSAVSSYGYTGSVTGLGATGSSTATLPPGSLFWLIVPRNNAAEGGYGSGVFERPPSPSAAVPQEPNRTDICNGL